jgi:glucan phosphoethanolaminetransferase (alkaline phosphatase superfamily)
LSTSVTAHKLTAQHKLILIDLFAALFCAVFGAVYELFSHGVYAYGMLYAFAFPLVLGVLPLLLITMRRAPYPNRFARSVYHAGIATLTVGSLVSGALEIYGTTNPLTLVYWIAGGVLTALGAAVYLVSRCGNGKEIRA